MKVLQINKFYPPHVGGVETVTRQVAEGLSAEGHTVRVLAGNHRVNLRTRVSERNGVKVWRAGSFGSLFNTTLSPTFPPLYRKCIEWAELVHFHSPSPTPEFTHWALGVPRDTSLVVTFHADPSTSRWKSLDSIYAPVLRGLLRRADRIAATAPANRNRSELLDGFEQKTEIIPLATEFEVEPPSEEDRGHHQKEIVGTETEPVILFVGRLCYYKGLQYLLRAMQKVNGRLVAVGDGELRGSLERKAMELNVDQKVQFEGYIPDERLSDYYRAADVFVLPSISSGEAFGIVQLDAMAHGVPVVNTSLPTGVPFVSQHEVTGLTVEPKDSDALASAMNRLVENREYRIQLGKKALRRAENFSKKEMAKRYENLYNKLVA